MNRTTLKLVTSLLVVAGLALALLRTSASAPARPAPVDDPVRDLTVDIHSLNLVNGLYLSRDQSQRLLALIPESARARDRFQQTLLDAQAEHLAALRVVRDELARGTLTPNAEKRYNRVHGRIEEARDAFLAQMQGLVDRTRGILTENQLSVVAEFSPCVIPNRNLRNPERVGQASGGQAEELLERARQVPADTYAQKKQAFLARARTVLLRHEDPKSVDARLARIAATADEARALSDADFAVKKSELAARIALPHPSRRGRELDECIARHLLNPSLLPVLTQRVAVAKNAP